MEMMKKEEETTKMKRWYALLDAAEFMSAEYVREKQQQLFVSTMKQTTEECCVRKRERVQKRPAKFQELEENNMQRKKLKRESENLDGKKEKEFSVRKRKRSSRMARNRRTMKKKKKKNVCKIEIPNPSRELPDIIKRRISAMGNHTNLQLVITKRLSKTDCNKSEHRLSMPLTKTADFLEEGEKVHLLGRKEFDRKNEIGVMLIQPNLEEIDINLREWEMKKKWGRTSRMYALVKPWNDVVLTNGLRKGDAIQVWSFRLGKEMKLAMAIVKLPNEEQVENVAP